MESTHISVEALKKQIVETEAKLRSLKEQLSRIEQVATEEREKETKWPLSAEEYKRYGRQMIVPSVGIQGQVRLKTARVLIVGAGGLGCPAAAYIAGAGVGTIGLVDGDEVEISNLHRQIAHTTERVGWKKVDSAIAFLKSLNPNPKYIAHQTHLTPQNAEEIVKDYDIILDCTDNPASRYLISDISILLRKPLISASALRTDGQLIVLNSPPLSPGQPGGPCYRCVFPKPPPAESVVSCGDGGILGPVVGVMGVLQAVETIKMISSGKLESIMIEPASMLLFSANGTQPFRSVKLRSRRKGCFACSEETQLTLDSLSSGSMDYVLFCGLSSPVNVLKPDERVSASKYKELRNKEHVLLDVREKVQFDICHLEGSINAPFSKFQGGKEQLDGIGQGIPIYVLCRFGNDSQVITRKLKDAGFGYSGDRYIGDIKGGLKAWREEVDKSWPEY